MRPQFQPRLLREHTSEGCWLQAHAAGDAVGVRGEEIGEVECRLRLDHIAARLQDGFLDGTTLMEYLIQRGVPMRQAHEIVGKLVRLCEGRGCRLADLTREDFAAERAAIADDVRNVLGVENAVRAFQGAGSTAPGEVHQQMAEWRKRLGITAR